MEFPKGTRFETERIFPDGSRGTTTWVVYSVKPAAGGGFEVILNKNDVTLERFNVPPGLGRGPIQPRNEKLVSVTTPAGTFLAGRLWRSEPRGHTQYETDTWLVPGLPMPVQTWSRPASEKHLYDPPADGTTPSGTILVRLIRIQKP